MRRKLVGLAAALGALAVTLSGCAAALPLASFAGRTPVFSPLQFFAGETRSNGVEETPDGAPSRRFTVKGEGQVLPDGGLRLDQTITYEGGTPRVRTWVITRLDEHRYRATLTDASGPLTAEAEGDYFHLSYPIKGVPLGTMEQWLYLQPDGCTVMNEGVARVAGLAMRRIAERISKVGCQNLPPAG